MKDFAVSSKSQVNINMKTFVRVIHFHERREEDSKLKIKQKSNERSLVG